MHKEHCEGEKNVVPSQSFKWYAVNSRTSSSSLLPKTTIREPTGWRWKFTKSTQSWTMRLVTPVSTIH